ncbi:EcsC protein family protein [Fontimonas thermophila]|uniref:EcsC protein family protein n=1 Tax=Fontimonas thermophila TaxID=1076937 RepID=A0A1I2GZ33_9GAMM|nr:EcsC family protein [Fontimonas thermophila]SFF22528.1 EcsC protein family protein [Fontimonas thermophila]
MIVPTGQASAKPEAIDAPDAYARARRADIQRWLEAPPDWGTRLLAKPSHVAARLTQQLVPVGVLRASLQALDGVAGRIAGGRDILRWAGVDTLEALAQRSLREADALARRVERRAILLAGGSGAALGIGGAAGMVADIPTLLTLALRTIHRTAYCYGEDWGQPGAQGLSIGVFALASANSYEEKRAAWAALHEGRPLLDAAWRDGVERIAERELAKDAAQFSLNTLASRIGAHLGTRKSGGALPVIGAVVGGAVNAGYIHDIAQAAQYTLAARCLRRMGLAPDTGRGA